MARDRIRGDRTLTEVRTPGGRTESQTFDNTPAGRRERDRWVRDVEHSKDRGQYISAKLGRTRVDEWCKTWRKTKGKGKMKRVGNGKVKREGLSPTTLARLDSVLKVHVIPTFGKMQLSAVRHSAVCAWVADMLEDYSPSTVRKSYFALSQMMAMAVRERYIKWNPCDGVELPAENENEEQRFLTMDEVGALAGAIEPRFRAFVLLAAYGGLRFGELAGLRRKRIDLLRGSVQIAETLVEVNGVHSFGPPKTKKSLRTVRLPRSVVKELQKHLDTYVEADPGAIAFTGPKGALLRRTGFGRCFWKPAVEAAGLTPLRIHDMRHTFVSLWVAAGRNVKEVSVAAGHSSVAFTLDRYGHLYERDDEALQDELDAQLRGLSAVFARTGDVMELRSVAERAR